MSMDMFDGTRHGALLAAATAGAGAVVEVVTKAEATLLNVPLSMLYVAIAGTMIGVFLLPAGDAAKLNSDPAAPLGRRLVYLLLAAGMLGATVLGYSYIAAWVVQAGVGIIGTVMRLTVDESVVLPVTGLVGVGIRPWLPALMKAVERRATRTIGGAP